MSNDTIKRVLGGGHMAWKDGEFSIWNVSGILMPFHTYVEVIRAMEKNCANAQQLMYAIGEKQAIVATDYMKHKFGFRRPVDLLNSVFEHIPMLGFGVFHTTKLDFATGNLLVCNASSPYAKHYKGMHGMQKSPVDAYLAGFVAGTMEAIVEKTLICIEQTCIATGSPQCSFEVKQLGNLKKKEKHFSSLLGPLHIRELCEKEKAVVSSPHKKSEK